MIRYTPYITKNAALDIMNAKLYYESKGIHLVAKFNLAIGEAIDRICIHPTAFTFRYKYIRSVKINSFPYLIFFAVDQKAQTIQLLRVFNTYQKPFWK